MQEIAVLGTGVVGQTLAFRAAEVGYSVFVGARSATSGSLEPFAHREGVTTGSFADAAASAQVLVINATNGLHSLEALDLAGAENLAGKTLLDVANELVPVKDGFPQPAATVDNSLGQRIQAAYPDTRVVKSLNTMNCQVMADPTIVPGDHVAFLSGENAAAKADVKDLLVAFGWRPQQLLDIGGIDSAAAVEMMMAIWLRVRVARGMDAPPFNWAVSSR
ncbi:MAG: 8-hydroxy-5-deazaflavin:NADPH oxidoreductase [Nocardioidaceae bacterium]|jgi:predicted dinucleotide-binding enzyme|nr:8-hydroxy-5-deazaflavin:NADPH oxidoreductase [Nocardioidaceae bacterium]